MNIYGCIPASFLPPHSALTYWAQAASLAGIVSSDPNLIRPNNLAVEIKKSQLPLSLCDAISKSNSESAIRAVARANDDLPSSRLNSVSSVTDALISVEDQERLQLQIHMQMQHLRRYHFQQQQQQQQYLHQEGRHHRNHHQPFSSSSPPPVGNGLAPLQALCESDVSAFRGKSSQDRSTPRTETAPIVAEASVSSRANEDGLKFGINRILSDDFGKTKNGKENSFQLSSVPEECRSLPLCPCSSAQCTAYAPRSLSPASYPRAPLPSLSAVHALQPPCYPLSSSVDALPGPYSILSSDPMSGSNQPKRKRSWSRAVFSNLQRKGLEKRFEVQKYVTKPDRRQLAAMLGLTDAQVKVWFQNRRMKWRHAQQQQGMKDIQVTDTDRSATEKEELDELTKYHDHNRNDITSEKGLDLRTKDESSIAVAEVKLFEAGTSLASSEDSESHMKIGSGLRIQPFGQTTSGFVSPILDCNQTITKDRNCENIYEHKIFTSTPKSSNEVVRNEPGSFVSDEEVFRFQCSESQASALNFSDGGDVSRSTQGHSTPRTLPLPCKRENPAEFDLSSAKPARLQEIQASTKTKNTGLDHDVEPVSNNDTNESRMRGLRDVHGTLEDCDDTAPFVHIDVDN